MTNTKGMTMPQIDDAELFGNAEDQRAYEDFCANQEAVEKFTLDKPALVCRWRMSNKKVPMLNRHIRALSERWCRASRLPTTCSAGPNNTLSGRLPRVITPHTTACSCW